MDWGLVAKLLPMLPPGLEGWWLFDKRVSSWSCKKKRIFFHPSFNITASKSGLSETELEDILCLDEEVLDEVFRFSMPEG